MPMVELTLMIEAPPFTPPPLAAISGTNVRTPRNTPSTLIRLKAVTMRTRPPYSFEVFAPSIDVVENDSGPRGTASQIASADAFRLAGIGPGDIDVAQSQDDSG